MSAVDPNPELCKKYAQFASHLDKWHFTVIYWSMFVANLFVLFLASWTYTKALDVIQKYDAGTKRLAKRLRLLIALCLGCCAASTVIVIMEAFCLMALQFCDGEDLISLYWSTWTMIQVGSLIAMFGVILALVHSLRDQKHPPWALALGTPVLIIAGLLHYTYSAIMRRVKKSRSKAEEKEGGPAMSQANTIQADPEDDEDLEGGKGADLVGFTTDGGMIVKFNRPLSMTDLPEHARLLGACDDDLPIVAYRKDSLKALQLSNTLSPSQDDSDDGSDDPKSSKGKKPASP